MRRKTFAIFSVAFALTCTLGILMACGHEHTFSNEWSKDAQYHWHAAACEHKDEVKDRAEHDFGGNRCSTCGYERQSAEAELKEDESAKVTTFVYGDTRLQLLSDSLVRIEDKSNGKATSFSIATNGAKKLLAAQKRRKRAIM